MEIFMKASSVKIEYNGKGVVTITTTGENGDTVHEVTPTFNVDANRRSAQIGLEVRNVKPNDDEIPF